MCPFPPKPRTASSSLCFQLSSTSAGAAWLGLSGLAGPEKLQQGRRHGWRHAQVREPDPWVVANPAVTWPPQSRADNYLSYLCSFAGRGCPGCCQRLLMSAHEQQTGATIRSSCCLAPYVARVQSAATVRH